MLDDVRRCVSDWVAPGRIFSSTEPTPPTSRAGAERLAHRGDSVSSICSSSAALCSGAGRADRRLARPARRARCDWLRRPSVMRHPSRRRPCRAARRGRSFHLRHALRRRRHWRRRPPTSCCADFFSDSSRPCSAASVAWLVACAIAAPGERCVRKSRSAHRRRTSAWWQQKSPGRWGISNAADLTLSPCGQGDVASVARSTSRRLRSGWRISPALRAVRVACASTARGCHVAALRPSTDCDSGRNSRSSNAACSPYRRTGCPPRWGPASRRGPWPPPSAPARAARRRPRLAVLARQARRCRGTRPRSSPAVALASTAGNRSCSSSAWWAG